MEEDKAPECAQPSGSSEAPPAEQREFDEKPHKPERKKKTKGAKAAVKDEAAEKPSSVSDNGSVNTIVQSDSLSLADSPTAPPLPNTNNMKVKINRLKEKLAKCSMKCNEADTKKEETPATKQAVFIAPTVREKRRSKSERTPQPDPAEKTESTRSMSFSVSSTSTNSTNHKTAAGRVKDDLHARLKKSRGQRGKKKASTGGPSDCPFYAEEATELILNAETFLLLDLLFMPPENRENFIVNLARKKQILVMDSNNTLSLNPTIIRCGGILPYRELVSFFGDKLNKKIYGVDVAVPADRQPTTFEDFVNNIVHQELADDQKKEFTFPVTAKRQRKTNYYKLNDFENNLEAFAQKCVEAKLGRIVEEEIRISAKNNDLAFMKTVDGERDAVIGSQLLRKGAMHGDVVRAFVRTSDEKPGASQNLDETLPAGEDEPVATERNRRAFVIKIVKEVNDRKVVGNFLSYRKDSKYITFVPRDMKVPNIRIFDENWPEAFKSGDVEHVADMLYVAEIIGWQDEICLGKILQPIGKCGELDSENKAILLQNNLNFEPYAAEFNERFDGEFKIPAVEYKTREDIRSECVFTIDPLTARDLDDALSCRQLHDGTFEVGVHISDVSYFLKENDELDRIVQQRTTSVYMVNEVFHMLPKPLCFRCSLLPGEEKLTFSVFWIMSSAGEILSTRFSRTIIKSCTQFAYQHAQSIIDNPDKEFHEMDFPQIHGGFKVEQVVRVVRQLNALATILRDKRFESGALKIDKPKIYFQLDAETGVPISYKPYESLTANFMIEEFMLLANQSVATFIYVKYPKLSILRNHLPPLKNVLKRSKELLKKMGLLVDVTSSKTIYDSLQRLIGESSDPKMMSVCLSQLISKPMLRASYICSEGREYDEFWHYALSIPIYTHFTSPIRRYPDILVHRVLAAALDYAIAPKFSPTELCALADRCNEGKYNAKVAGEDSIDLYFFHYIKSQQSITVRAVIVGIFTYSFEAILIETGHQIVVSFKECKNLQIKMLKDEAGMTTVQVFFETQPNEPVLLKTAGNVWLEVTSQKKRLRGQIVPPPQPMATSKPKPSEPTPSSEPNPSATMPSSEPSLMPSSEPSLMPSSEPSLMPSSKPSLMPSSEQESSAPMPSSEQESSAPMPSLTPPISSSDAEPLSTSSHSTDNNSIEKSD